MTRPRLRRSIPHGLVALSLVAVTLLGALTVAPAEVVADTPGGQASIYNAIPQTLGLCGGLEIPFFQGTPILVNGNTQTIGTKLHIFNPRSSAVSFTLRATGEGGSALGTFSLAATVPPRGEVIFASFDRVWTSGTTPSTTGPFIPLPDRFTGTVRAVGCENVRLVASVEFGSTSGNLPTLTPTTGPTRTNTPTLVATNTALPTATATPQGPPIVPGFDPGDSFASVGSEAVFAAGSIDSKILAAPAAQVSFVPLFTSAASGCRVATPLFMNNRDGMSSTIVLRNESENSTSAEVRLVALGGGALTTRTFDIAASGSLSLSGNQLGLSAGFAGSLIADACPPRVNPGELSALVIHNSNSGDSTAIEAQNVIVGTQSNDLYVPAAHNDDNGFNSQVVLQNMHPDNDLTAKVEIHPDGGAQIDRSITIRSESAAVIDLASLPKGAMSIKIEGPRGALDPRLIVAAYHMGPGGMAAGGNGFSPATAGRRLELPLIFRASGLGGGYESIVRVMKAGAGAVSPRITLRDRDSNERIGPITATRPDNSTVVLREDEGIFWDVSKLPGLRAGRYYAAEVDDEDGGTLVATAGYLNTGRSTAGAYNGLDRLAAGKVFTAPLVVKNVDGMNTGIELQDLAGREQTVTIRFFNDRGGRQEGATLTQSVPENGSSTVYLPTEPSVPDGSWTAEISSTDRIAAVVNTVRYR